MPVSEIKFVEAYRASHPLQAHALRFALEEAGISVVIENEALQDAIGDLPSGWSCAPRLMVEESQLAAARAIISRTDHSEHSKLGLKPSETALLVSGAGLLTAGSLTGISLEIVLAPNANVESEPGETTRCLACDAIMTEAEAMCPKCGWSYESDGSAEPV